MLAHISKFFANLFEGISQARVRNGVAATRKDLDTALASFEARPQPERDLAAQLIDEAMRGDPHWEAARAIVVARDKTPTIDGQA